MTRLVPLMVVLLVIAPFAHADSPSVAAGEIERVLDNLGKMVDVATEIEKYQIGHHALPAAKSPAELSAALMGSDSIVAYLIDPWGTPYAIDCSPKAGSYMIVSAGSDRTFERTSWTAPGATHNAASDIVIRDGVVVRSPREWALSEFHKIRPDTTKVLVDSLEQSRAAGTLMNVNAMRIALLDYKAAHGGKMPAGSADDVFNALANEHTYLQRDDQWGTPLRIAIRGSVYRIASAGSDRRFDDGSAKPRAEAFAKDLVCDQTGCPDDWLQNKDVGEAYTNLLLFEAKYAALKTLGPEKRAKIRREALEKELDRKVAHFYCVEAAACYEALENEFPGFEDRERLLALSSAVSRAPEPPPSVVGQQELQRFKERHKNDHLMTDAERINAMRSTRTLLGRYVVKHPDDDGVVWELAMMTEKTGGATAALAVVERYCAAHPQDAPLNALRSELYIKTGQGKKALDEAAAKAQASPGDPEKWYQAGLTAYEAVTKRPAATSTAVGASDASAADERAIIDKGIAWMERARALKPDYFEAMVFENLLYRQAAQRETSPAKQQALTAKADALRDAAKAIMDKKRQQAGRP